MSGAGGQLGFHIGAAMNTGLTEAQVENFVSVLTAEVGKAQGDSAQKVLAEVLKTRK